jgi:hypothetical protein
VRAAATVRTDPVLLMAVADKESSFLTEVQARTSPGAGGEQVVVGDAVDAGRAEGGVEVVDRLAQGGELVTARPAVTMMADLLVMPTPRIQIQTAQARAAHGPGHHRHAAMGGAVAEREDVPVGSRHPQGASLCRARTAIRRSLPGIVLTCASVAVISPHLAGFLRRTGTERAAGWTASSRVRWRLLAWCRPSAQPAAAPAKVWPTAQVELGRKTGRMLGPRYGEACPGSC